MLETIAEITRGDAADGFDGGEAIVAQRNFLDVEHVRDSL
jgi:hypothetical protein